MIKRYPFAFFGLTAVTLALILQPHDMSTGWLIFLACLFGIAWATLIYKSIKHKTK